MVVFRMLLSIIFSAFLGILFVVAIALIISPKKFLKFCEKLFQKIEEQSEVKLDPDLEAYQKKHQELVDKFYKELGGPEISSEEEIEDSPKIVEDEALTEVKSLLEGIVPPDIPFSETAIRQYLWEMKRTAGMNEDLFRNDLDWRLRQW